MGGAGTVAIADAVSKQPQLRELYLDDNDLSSPEAIAAVAKLIASNTNLRVLGLASNKIEADGMKIICSALGSNTNLETLELSENFFGDLGVTELIKVLRGNKTLLLIKLFNDEISNVGALQLATLMASGECCCREIAFSNNHLINADGMKQVRDTVRFSDFEEVGMLTFRKRGNERRAVQQAGSVAAPLLPVSNHSVPTHSNTRLIILGLAAVALGLGTGLFLATRQRSPPFWFFGSRTAKM